MSVIKLLYDFIIVLLLVLDLDARSRRHYIILYSNIILLFHALPIFPYASLSDCILNMYIYMLVYYIIT